MFKGHLKKTLNSSNYDAVAKDEDKGNNKLVDNIKWCGDAEEKFRSRGGYIL